MIGREMRNQADIRAEILNKRRKLGSCSSTIVTGRASYASTAGNQRQSQYLPARMVAKLKTGAQDAVSTSDRRFVVFHSTRDADEFALPKTVRSSISLQIVTPFWRERLAATAHSAHAGTWNDEILPPRNVLPLCPPSSSFTPRVTHFPYSIADLRSFRASVTVTELRVRRKNSAVAPPYAPALQPARAYFSTATGPAYLPQFKSRQRKPTQIQRYNQKRHDHFRSLQASSSK